MKPPSQSYDGGFVAESHLAASSPDHIHPWGTKRCNGSNPRFVTKVCNLFPKSQVPAILDLGCAGGKMVMDFHDAGCFAHGIEGSDYSQRTQRAEWKHDLDILHTADIGKPFRFDRRFDIITLWEVVEHLNQGTLAGLVDNLENNLKAGGMVIISTTSGPDWIDGVNLHQTMWPKEKWVKYFANGLLYHQPKVVDYFNHQWVRGRNETKDGFHLCLTKTPAWPTLPKESLAVRIYDRWAGSKIQQVIAGTALTEALQ